MSVGKRIFDFVRGSAGGSGKLQTAAAVAAAQAKANAKALLRKKASSVRTPVADLIKPRGSAAAVQATKQRVARDAATRSRQADALPSRADVVNARVKKVETVSRATPLTPTPPTSPVVKNKAAKLNRNLSRLQKKAKIKALKAGRFVGRNKRNFALGTGGLAAGVGGATILNRRRDN